MGNSNSQSKIIKQICKEVLFPIGVFQYGNSRVYIDDNGWFLTLIEFQPSSWSKGSALNISLHFLWASNEYLIYDFPFGNVCEKSYVEYTDDMQFEQVVREYAEFARERILCYRRLRDIRTAKRWAWKQMWRYRKNPHAKNLRSIWRLNQKELLTVIGQNRAYWRSQPGMGGLPRYEPYERVD